MMKSYLTWITPKFTIEKALRQWPNPPFSRIAAFPKQVLGNELAGDDKPICIYPREWDRTAMFVALSEKGIYWSERHPIWRWRHRIRRVAFDRIESVGYDLATAKADAGARRKVPSMASRLIVLTLSDSEKEQILLDGPAAIGTAVMLYNMLRRVVFDLVEGRR